MGTSAPPLVIVVGPTASGKSQLALRLAESSGGEIIGADSVQIFRYFDVGSGKPTADERARVRHHLVDVVSPHDKLDAAQFAALADEAISDVRRRGRVPIVCGGTFLWVRALVLGLAKAPPADEAIRQRHRAIAEREGRAALHAELRRIDPAAAERLAPNDFVRVSRSLEMFALTGTTQSEWHAEHGFRERRYRAVLVGIDYERPALDERIGRRITAMLEAGWVEEVRGLIERGFGSCRAMGSVGYRQIAEALREPPINAQSLRFQIDQATRIFARRQRTWLRAEPVLWLAPDRARTITLQETLDRARLW